ncbi:hypothetical protein HYT33_01730 [Candidatus Roizmanbacteria bacterium]|nr:hypothetical protein [Candidatus Roizmanbacteria bacterium]
MQTARTVLQKTVELFQGATSGVICLPENPKVDTIAAATSLYLGLTKLGKNVSLASSKPLKSELIAADKIQEIISTSGDNLVISFPYTDGSADRVDYYIQGDAFNVVVTPGKDFPKLKPEQVSFGYSGGNVDFIVTIDCASLKNLGSLYADNQELFTGKKIINIARHLANTFFGTVNFVTRGVSSTSEVVLTILRSLNAEVDPDMASNLYQGLVSATGNFTTPTITPETFETAAYLLKQGAVKATEEKPQVRRTIKPPKDTEKDEEWLKPKIFRPGPGETS